MSDAADRTTALSLLLTWLQKDVVPPLTQLEIEAVLDQYKVASYWAANTAYSPGQRILPPTRNGYWYQVVQPGTSQITSRAFNDWPTFYGSRLSDGSSDPQLILENQGTDSIFRINHSDPLSVNVYDVRGAARQCILLLRKTKAQQYITDDGDGAAAIFDRLDALANQFYPIRFPVTVVRG